MLLITHAQTELSVACIGVIVAILTLIVLSLTSGKKSVIEIIKGVDYKTLLFFIGLFVSVAGLEKTGVLNMIANFITSVSEGNIAVIVIVILWLSAITSAFVDNIPFAATMIPVIRAIAATEGMDIGVLAWALSLGTDLGGNATPIGASANVVGTSASAKGGYPIGWGRYCKYCVPATIIVMAVSTAYLFLTGKTFCDIENIADNPFLHIIGGHKKKHARLPNAQKRHDTPRHKDLQRDIILIPM